MRDISHSAGHGRSEKLSDQKPRAECVKSTDGKRSMATTRPHGLCGITALTVSTRLCVDVCTCIFSTYTLYIYTFIYIHVYMYIYTCI